MPLMFKIDEVMSGTHNYKGKEQNFTFHLRWGGKLFAEFLNPRHKNFATAFTTGFVDVGGMADKIPLEPGTLEIRYCAERKLRYKFKFTHEGKKYSFVGEKVNIRPWNLPWTHTTCYGKLTEESSNQVVANSVTHFRYKTIPAFLFSFRVFKGR